jgi:hypothetical protein
MYIYIDLFKIFGPHGLGSVIIMDAKLPEPKPQGV